MDYATVRAIHIGCVAASIFLFTLRAGFALASRDWRSWRPLRWLPHANDTLLLAAGVTLAVWSHQSPWAHPWLAIKIGLLLVYIALGRVALKPVLEFRARLVYTSLAMLTVFAIVAVATTRLHWPGSV